MITITDLYKNGKIIIGSNEGAIENKVTALSYCVRY